MSSFINLDFDKSIYWKYFSKHILYSLIWIIGFYILIFRGDYFLLNVLPEEYRWILITIPVIFLSFLVIIIIKTKWYFTIALLFYPFLIIFWFLPKFILKKGKIYLLSGYVNFIYNRIKHFKSALIHLLLLIVIVLLLVISDSNITKVIGMMFFSYLYYRIVAKYIRQSFQPARLFGSDIDHSLELIIKSPETSFSIIKKIEENTSDTKLPENEITKKRLERLIIINSIIEYFGTNLNKFKGKKAFVISWIYQLIGFIMITLMYFTFINFELFRVSSLNFNTTSEPSVFDFFYYTIKTITFSNIESIIPLSILSKIIEIISFLTLGVFLLIIVTSVIFTLRQDRINSNIEKATEVCITQNKYLTEYIKLKYKTDIETALSEASNIKASIDNIKKLIENIF